MLRKSPGRERFQNGKNNQRDGCDHAEDIKTAVSAFIPVLSISGSCHSVEVFFGSYFRFPGRFRFR